MGDVGPPKDLLRERIKNKRAHEGLEDIPPEELFQKKPKYDLSDEEKGKLSERRKRNKEAAEKSRKKKKDEFEKLQSENDQLAQDKCEMAAMIEQLKKELQKVLKENSEVRGNLDGLKRWIGKRVHMLGLVDKHPGTSKSETGAAEASGKSVLTRGDPSLRSAVGEPDTAEGEEKGVTPPSPPLSPPSFPTHSQNGNPSPPPAHQHQLQLSFKMLQTLQQPRSATPPEQEFKPVGIYTSQKGACPTQVAPQKNHTLQSPWIVDPPAAAEPAEPEDLSTTAPDDNDFVITNGAAPAPRVSASQPTRIRSAVPLLNHPQRSEEQQVIYLPKDTIFVVDNNLPALSFGYSAQAQPITVMNQTNAAGATIYPAREDVKIVQNQPVEFPAPAPVFLPVSASVAVPTTYATSFPMSVPISVSGNGIGRVYRSDVIYPSSSPRPHQAEFRAVEGGKEFPASGASTRLADPEVMTAIESLLKLGYRIEMSSGAPQVTAMPMDQGYQPAPHGYVTVSAPGMVESSGTFTIKTSA